MDITGLGMAALDIVLRSHDLPSWERGVPFSGVALEGGGPVATALAAASRLGAQVGFVGTYGSDRLGTIKLETLTEFGVDVQCAIKRPGPDDQVMLVNVQEETGERTFSWVKAPARQTLAPEELDREYLVQAAFLHLDGFHMRASLQAARWMHAAGKQVMLDAAAGRGPVSDEMRALTGETDYLICGSGFTQALTGCPSLEEAGQAALALGPRAVVQTEGLDGSYSFTQTECFHTPAFEVPVVDTTGAGDVFHGAYLVGLIHGWDARRVAIFSTAVAAIKCTQLSGRRGIPTFAQAIDFLCSHGYKSLDFL